MTDRRLDGTVAVLNSSEDTIEMLRHCLQQNGFSSIVSAHVTSIRSGEINFVRFIEEHDPKVFIYDISIPYDNNWTFLKLLLDTEHMRGRKVVVTTTNKKRLEELVGPTDAFEIVGKPYDLKVIVEAVKKAFEYRS